MHDPVSTPDGYLFERAALEDVPGHNVKLYWDHLTFCRTGPASMDRILSLVLRWF